MRKKEETHLHFVGIGGIGMSGIAEVFLNQGYKVSGSDLHESDITKRLSELGAQIRLGHQAENVRGAHVVVTSSAIRTNNPELQEAKRLRIPIIPRAEMLGELMRGKIGIAVAGTHGKTTTTSMLATVLTAAGLDPTLVIGGKVDSLGGNAKLGRGKYVVAEADESDGSFLHLPSTYAVVTNIDDDHMDHFGTLEKLEQAFVKFVGRLPFYGMAAVCGEDPGVARCMDRWTKPYLTYGLSSRWDVYGSKIKFEGGSSFFEVHFRDESTKPHRLLGQIKLNVPGKHNVLNALATITIGLQLELSFEIVARALAEFRGVRRRFEIKWRDDAKSRIIVDDYGHHPTEIAATLSAARAFWPGRIVTVFQPHRYTRTANCKLGFLSAFNETDVLLLTDIYPAGEEPIPGVTSAVLAKEIAKVYLGKKEIAHVGDLESAKEQVVTRVRDGDLILCLGAGSVTKLADMLVAGMGVSK